MSLKGVEFIGAGLWLRQRRSTDLCAPQVSRAAFSSGTYLDCFFLGGTILPLLQRFSLNRVGNKREEFETRTQGIQGSIFHVAEIYLIMTPGTLLEK